MSQFGLTWFLKNTAFTFSSKQSGKGNLKRSY